MFRLRSLLAAAAIVLLGSPASAAGLCVSQVCADLPGIRVYEPGVTDATINLWEDPVWGDLCVLLKAFDDVPAEVPGVAGPITVAELCWIVVTGDGLCLSLSTIQLPEIRDLYVQFCTAAAEACRTVQDTLPVDVSKACALA